MIYRYTVEIQLKTVLGSKISRIGDSFNLIRIFEITTANILNVPNGLFTSNACLQFYWQKNGLHLTLYKKNYNCQIVYITARYSLIFHLIKRTWKAITTHATATNSLTRSPTLLAFQQKPTSPECSFGFASALLAKIEG